MALSKLDFLNVILLLPSLLFSVSCLAGPFLMKPKPGTSLGPWVWAPRTAGWLTGILFYTLIASLAALRGWPEWVAWAGLAGAVGYLLRRGLRYAAYPWMMRRRLEALRERIEKAGTESRGISLRMMEGWNGGGGWERDKLPAVLGVGGVPEKDWRGVMEQFHTRLAPLLDEPGSAWRGENGRSTRARCEFQRSLTLSLLTFVWFLFVPVPGLLVFNAGSYRFAFPVESFIAALVSVVIFVLAAAVAGRAVERVVRREGSGRGSGLSARIQRVYGAFRRRVALHGSLTHCQTSGGFALLSGIQTYWEQRSYEYVRCTLAKIEELVNSVPVCKSPQSSRKSDLVAEWGAVSGTSEGVAQKGTSSQ
jgi:hypothetical protein